MSQEEIKSKLCREALALCEDRMKSVPESSVLEMYRSIKRQLEYLIAYFEGRNKERYFNTLTFGHYASREIEDSDPELGDALKKAYYVAIQTSKGLRIDLKAVGIDS